MSGDVTYRPAIPADLPLVKQTLYLALYWDPDDPIPPSEPVVDHPEIATYHAGWMQPGDAGIVAELDGSFAGMAYYRFFAAEHHGQGFIDEDTPELAVGVVHDLRGRGIGTRLLRDLATVARTAGVGRISLSVSEGNRARKRYERCGYVAAPGNDVERMVLALP